MEGINDNVLVIEPNVEIKLTRLKTKILSNFLERIVFKKKLIMSRETESTKRGKIYAENLNQN